ncbi:uncharacterized protein ACR2FA_001466 [Aphomia sociella]
MIVTRSSKKRFKITKPGMLGKLATEQIKVVAVAAICGERDLRGSESRGCTLHTAYLSMWYRSRTTSTPWSILPKKYWPFLPIHCSLNDVVHRSLASANVPAILEPNGYVAMAGDPMKTTIIILLLYCGATLIVAEQASTKDLYLNEDSEELERRHRKRKKHQQNGGCGYGRTFGEKFFGLHEYTYVSAPVMNYFFGCGIAAVPVAPVPVAPVAPVQPLPVYPVQISQSQSQSNHGHHGHHGQGGFGGPGNFGGFNQGYPQGGFQRPPPAYNQGQYPLQNRPFQSAVSAAASGFGTALADYISRPKTQKQINRQINQFFRPITKLF